MPLAEERRLDSCSSRTAAAVTRRRSAHRAAAPASLLAPDEPVDEPRHRDRQGQEDQRRDHVRRRVERRGLADQQYVRMKQQQTTSLPGRRSRRAARQDAGWSSAAPSWRRPTLANEFAELQRWIRRPRTRRRHDFLDMEAAAAGRQAGAARLSLVVERWSGMEDARGRDTARRAAALTAARPAHARLMSWWSQGCMLLLLHHCLAHDHVTAPCGCCRHSARLRRIWPVLPREPQPHGARAAQLQRPLGPMASCEMLLHDRCALSVCTPGSAPRSGNPPPRMRSAPAMPMLMASPHQPPP